MFVYLIRGSGIPFAQINNTPHLHSMGWTQNVPTEHTNTSGESIRYPRANEIFQISYQGLAKHFH